MAGGGSGSEPPPTKKPRGGAPSRPSRRERRREPRRRPCRRRGPGMPSASALASAAAAAAASLWLLSSHPRRVRAFGGGGGPPRRANLPGGRGGGDGGEEDGFGPSRWRDGDGTTTPTNAAGLLPFGGMFGDGGGPEEEDERAGGGVEGADGRAPASAAAAAAAAEEIAASARGGGASSDESSEAAEAGPGIVARVASPLRGALRRLRGPTDAERAHDDAVRKLRTTRVRCVTAPNSTVLPDEVIDVAARRSGLLGGTLTTERVQECARHLTAWYRRKGYVLHSVTGATLHAPDEDPDEESDRGRGGEGKGEGGERVPTRGVAPPPPAGTAVLSVREPRLSPSRPVDVVAAREMVLVHPSDDLNDHPEGREQVLTFRQYRERLARRMTGEAGRRAAQSLKKADLNTTYVEAEARTSAAAVARTLDLRPGESFRWNPGRWRGVLRSGVFSRVLSVGPRRNPDGTVTLEVVATESPPRSLEYGVSRSLYTGGWEGELDFEHANLLGGGEKVGLIVRRGAMDLEPSVRVRFHDDRLGAPGGYDVEVFSDYIGRSGDEDIHLPGVKDIGNFKNFKFRRAGRDEPAAEAEAGAALAEPHDDDDDPDALLDRRGLCLRLQDPLLPLCPPSSSSPIDNNGGGGGGLLSRLAPRRSDATLSAERASTRSGVREYIGSANLGMGPVRRELGLGARADVSGNVGWGARVSASEGDGEGSSSSCFGLLPYLTGTVSARQIFPLLDNGPSSSSGGLLTDSNIVGSPSASGGGGLVIPTNPNAVVPAGGASRDGRGRPVELALSHSLRLSSPNLPRHEANAVGFRSGVRGYGRSSCGALRGSVAGTAEIRVPLTVPGRLSRWLGGEGGVAQDGAAVLFGDWMAGAPLDDAPSESVSGTGSVPPAAGEFSLGGRRLLRRSSVGMGLRKSVQGIPVKYDVCWTADGRVGAFVGLGRDFDV